MKKITLILACTLTIGMALSQTASARTRVVCRCIEKASGTEIVAPGGPLIIVSPENPWTPDNLNKICAEFGDDHSDKYSSCRHNNGNE